MHRETEAYLYEENNFVIASFKWMWPDLMFAPQGWVSHISRSRVARMKHYCMRVHFVGNGGNESHGQTKEPIQFLLLHANHLDELCLTIQVQALLTVGPTLSYNL